MSNYSIEDIESLSFKEGVRAKIPMYLGTDDTEGIYQSLKEVINNATDEALMGFGKKIIITVNEKENSVSVIDEGRGIPFGLREDGENVLVSIFSRPHTGGKFNNKNYTMVSGINGIGVKATCLSSENFIAVSSRNGEKAEIHFKEGELISYEETIDKSNKHGTFVKFNPDKKVFKNMIEGFSYNKICEVIKITSYLTNGITFTVINEENQETKNFYSENGIGDFIKDKTKFPLMSAPITAKAKDETAEIEIAFIWTNEPSNSYVFVNGLICEQGGTPITGAKTTITTTIKRLTKKEFDPEIIRKGLVYAINCKVAEPSFANQTKSKINNPNLRTLASQAFKEGLEDFANRRKEEFNNIIEVINKTQRAEKAAEKARQQVLDATKDIEKNQKRKVFASDKLKDAEFLGQDSTLLVVEGSSALGSMSQARDYTKFGLLEVRGKMINYMSNPEDKVFANEEIKLLLSAMNIVPGKYDSKKLRYGKLGICVDAD